MVASRIRLVVKTVHTGVFRTFYYGRQLNIDEVIAMLPSMSDDELTEQMTLVVEELIRRLNEQA